MAKQCPFIVLEALDAGGSQTQTDLLVKRLRGDGFSPTQLHFPQEDRATGRFIYDKFLLSNVKKTFSQREQALLYIQDFFSRSEDMWNVVQGKRGKDVLVNDRYCTSTMAYQTIGKTGKKRLDSIRWIRHLCYEGTVALPKPDMVVFIDTPVAISLERLQGKPKDFFETKTKLTAIRNSYVRLAQEEGWVVVSGVDARGQQRTRADIHSEIWQSVEALVA